MEASRIKFHVEIDRVIELLSKQIYQSPLALLRENTQNAYDAILMRQHVQPSFVGSITVTIASDRIVVADDGIGMTREQLAGNYWRAGASGKNTQEARAAGVVGTFGVGAMANFGVASELIVTSESLDGQRTTCVASRETLSVTEDCIEMRPEAPTRRAGTTVTAVIDKKTQLDVPQAVKHLEGLVTYLPVPVTINGALVQTKLLNAAIGGAPNALRFSELGLQIGPKFKADIKLAFDGNGGPWIQLNNLQYEGTLLRGEVLLKQGLSQIRTYRSLFALASAAVSSSYLLGGVANLAVLEPTAGREALTTASVQLLQAMVSELEHYLSRKLSESELANENANFLNYVSNHKRFDLCGNVRIRTVPREENFKLGEVAAISKTRRFHYYEGTNAALIRSLGSDDAPLLVLSQSQPRRNCESAYLQMYCKVDRVVDSPHVVSVSPEGSWSDVQAGLAIRLTSILGSDYFLEASIQFGEITHGVSVLVNKKPSPIVIVLDPNSAPVSAMLKVFDEDFESLTGILKDFVRSAIFPKISDIVPSSTKEGAEAFLKVIRRPKELFEYEYDDIGKLQELIRDYREGRINIAEASRKVSTLSGSVQTFRLSQSEPVAKVLPDILENDRKLETGELLDLFSARPAISRLGVSSQSKVLTIDPSQPDLDGYRCFVAIAEKVRRERSDFFLQPHRTEIVWSGQKAMFVFTHHSGSFALYYELQGQEVLAEATGGSSYPTCTIVISNQVYIPVPSEISSCFMPTKEAGKRFEVRSDLLYPE